MSRDLSQRDLAYENLGADSFEAALSEYDTRRRVEVLVDDFLGDMDLEGKRVLEVGCGLGYFSRALLRRGCDLTVSDISPALVEKVSGELGCRGVVADAMCLGDTFHLNEFHGLLSSECIEHTPDPAVAVSSMTGIVQSGGWISLSTPNLLWQPLVRAASLLRLRRFDGYENFSTIRSLTRELEAGGFDVRDIRGLHPWPFQLPLRGLARLVEDQCQFAKAGMINLCVFARKR